VSGGFSANFVPSSLDPLLQGLTQSGARLLDPEIVLNPLNNYFFTTASSVIIIGLGWYLTEKVVEPRLKNVELDGDLEDLPRMHALEPNEKKGLNASLLALGLGVAFMIYTALQPDSAWRDANGSLATGAAPIMRSIVSLIFLMFVCRQNDHELKRRHRRHDQGDAPDVLLPGHHVFHRTVCVRVRSVESWRPARIERSGRFAGDRDARCGHAGRYCAAYGFHQSVRGFGNR
jgi:hypothetical protein